MRRQTFSRRTFLATLAALPIAAVTSCPPIRITRLSVYDGTAWRRVTPITIPYEDSGWTYSTADWRQATVPHERKIK